MAHVQDSPDLRAPLEAPGGGREASIADAIEVSRLPVEELRRILVRFAAFQEAHPHAGLSLLEFARRDLDEPC